MNKQDLISKIKQLEGISQDERAYLIDLVNTKKKYGLVWEDKPEEVEEQLRENLPVLKEVKEKAIINDDGSLSGAEVPNHILIEGDNLHALTALTFTHEGMIDVIYIDPPYNTGENDFKYNDSYIDKENGFRHSMWLSFISKRLKIIKKLLSNTGVLLVHIDENEFDALSLLLETEIFKEQDCLGYIIWNKKNPKGDAKGVATMHEYILCFAKNKTDFLSLEGTLSREKPNAVEILKKAKTLYSKIGKKIIPDEVKEVISPFNYSNEILKDFEVIYDLGLVNKEFKSWLARKDFSKGEKMYKYIDDKGKVYRGVHMGWPNKEQAPDDYFIPLIHPLTGKPCPVPERGWRNPSSTMQRLLGDKPYTTNPDGSVLKGEILFGKDEKKQPERKYRLEENMKENTPSLFDFGGSDDSFFASVGLDFPYAKPVEVAKYLLNSIHPNPKIILDCFAGSGTTLHAVLELNKKDKKDRVGIIVTNNEVDAKTEKVLLKKGLQKDSEEFENEGICRKITYPRIKKVIQGYQDKEGNTFDGLTKNNLRYFKTEYVSREQTLKNKRELTLLATELLSIKEDCYTEITATLISESKQNWIKIFANRKTQFVVIYDELRIEDAIPIIQQLHEQKTNDNKIKVYVFSNGQYPYTEDFEEVLPFITLCALPDAIYKAYQNVLPSKKRKAVVVDEENTDESGNSLEENEQHV